MILLPVQDKQGRVHVQGLGQAWDAVALFKQLLAEAGFEVGSSGTTGIVTGKQIIDSSG